MSISRRHTLIYLAGGNARRFESNKLLSSFLQRPLFEHALCQCARLQKLYPENFDLIVVSQYEDLLKRAQEIAPHARIVHCKECEEGLSHSIKAGLDHADHSIDATFVLADQPLVQLETLRNYFKSLEAAGLQTGAFSRGDVLIAPVSFAPELFDDLYRLEKDQGGKKVLLHYKGDIFYYPALEYELIDVDTKEQMERLEKLADLLTKEGFLPQDNF